MPPSLTRPKVFISHCAQDRAFVRRLTRVFDEHRIPYWYSGEHIRGAQEWHDEIGRGLKSCNWFLVVLTPAAVRSTWVKRELSFALRQRRYNDKIIPVLLKRCRFHDLSWTLGELEFVDFTGHFGDGCARLLRIWDITAQSKPPHERPPSRNKGR